MIEIYDRKNKKIINEEQFGYKYLDFLYNKKKGRFLLKVAISPFISKIYGLHNKTIFSKKKANRFIKENNIDINNFEIRKYNSFNKIFTRKIKEELVNKNSKKNEFISPAESKVSVYKITKDLKVDIKESIYSLKELLNEEIDNSFINGNLIIFRLSVDNYHRYCYVDDGSLIRTKYIKGKLHTVSSISKDYEIYKENKRVVSLLKTDNFGEIYQIEVGALLVGKIINHKVNSFKKYDEKGYFDVGGSTIVILTKDNIKIDKDIMDYSKKGIETLVEYGEKIGEVK